jgi:aerobic-type carbon monoxide dehydrogenase small subunit (CoxS/CutS family)
MTDIDIRLTVNGTHHVLPVAPNIVLADLLRDRLGLTGCKLACDQGVCGACTVLLNGTPVAACTRFAFMADRAEVTTIEGLNTDIAQRLRDAFLARGAVQCGFCTAGLLLSATALLQEHPTPDDDTIDAWLGGNLCRCTGYRKIRDAISAAAQGPAQVVS